MSESAQDQVGPWAHNTDRSGPNSDVPVVWENTENPPSDPENWHAATDDEYTAYIAYWEGKEQAWGACGVDGCIECRPLYDVQNNPIAGT